MKATLDRAAIVGNISSEEDLSDCSMMESFYAIRKLKALAESLEKGSIEINDSKSGQIFSKKYDIWFGEDEYEEVW